jgi:hypothetical protein
MYFDKFLVQNRTKLTFLIDKNKKNTTLMLLILNIFLCSLFSLFIETFQRRSLSQYVIENIRGHLKFLSVGGWENLGVEK